MRTLFEESYTRATNRIDRERRADKRASKLRAPPPPVAEDAAEPPPPEPPPPKPATVVLRVGLSSMPSTISDTGWDTESATIFPKEVRQQGVVRALTIALDTKAMDASGYYVGAFTVSGSSATLVGCAPFTPAIKGRTSQRVKLDGGAKLRVSPGQYLGVVRVGGTNVCCPRSVSDAHGRYSGACPSTATGSAFSVQHSTGDWQTPCLQFEVVTSAPAADSVLADTDAAAGAPTSFAVGDRVQIKPSAVTSGGLPGEKSLCEATIVNADEPGMLHVRFDASPGTFLVEPPHLKRLDGQTGKVGCGPDCNLSHSGDGNCLVCGKDWGCHSGHMCQGGGGLFGSR